MSLKAEEVKAPIDTFAAEDCTCICIIFAIFYPFSQFCEIDVSLPSL